LNFKVVSVYIAERRNYVQCELEIESSSEEEKLLKPQTEIKRNGQYPQSRRTPATVKRNQTVNNNVAMSKINLEG